MAGKNRSFLKEGDGYSYKCKILDAEFSVSLSDIQTSCMGGGRATQDDVARRRADRLNFNLFLCPLPIRGNCVGGL